MTGQLTLTALDGKPYLVAFDRGAVVGASSPLTTDSAARVALTNHLITSSQVTQVARLVAANPDQDEIELLAEACRLDPDRTLRLRQRVIAQRAARTFAVEYGDFVVDDQIAIPISHEAAVDFRAIVYLGIRMNLSQQRLVADLRLLGSHFLLRPDALEDLAQFGLGTTERPIVEALRVGTTLPELEAAHREIDPRSVHSVVYALTACRACEVTGRIADLVPDPPPITARQPTTSNIDGIFIKSTPRTMTMDEREPRTAIGTGSLPSRTSTLDSEPMMPRTMTNAPTISRTTSLTREPRPSQPTISRTTSLSSTLPPRTRTPSEPMRSRVPHDDGGGSVKPRSGPTTQPMNVPRTQSPTLGRTPSPTSEPPVTPTLPRTPSEPRTPVVPRTTSVPLAPRTATPTLSPRLKAPSEPRTQTFTGEEPSGAQRVQDPLAAAAEAYQRGQSALRDDQVELAIEELQKATELNPHEFDYAAILAWAQFCGAIDRRSVADKTRKMLARAVDKSKNPSLARFYLGRMERMLGRDREALRHFQQVLEDQPRNADAASEIRQLESRLASGSGEKPGLASLFGRKKT
ncbi:MAG: hypothetical protein ABI867_11980 [Kofleriaceae bacterium]